MHLNVEEIISGKKFSIEEIQLILDSTESSLFSSSKSHSHAHSSDRSDGETGAFNMMTFLYEDRLVGFDKKKKHTIARRPQLISILEIYFDVYASSDFSLVKSYSKEERPQRMVVDWFFKDEEISKIKMDNPFVDGFDAALYENSGSEPELLLKEVKPVSGIRLTFDFNADKTKVSLITAWIHTDSVSLGDAKYTVGFGFNYRTKDIIHALDKMKVEESYSGLKFEKRDDRYYPISHSVTELVCSDGAMKVQCLVNKKIRDGIDVRKGVKTRRGKNSARPQRKDLEFELTSSLFALGGAGAPAVKKDTSIKHKHRSKYK
jgi:hypothetical protein